MINIVAKNSIVFLLSCLLIYSCKKLDGKEYITWFASSENGFSESKSIDGVEFNAYLRPPLLMVYNEVKAKNKDQINRKELDSLLLNYGNGINIIFEMSSIDKNTPISDLLIKKEYQDIALAGECFSFIMGLDTIKPSIFHFEREFEMNKKSLLNFL